MAKINAGILGGFSGSIHSVTGYRRLDKNIIVAKRRIVRPASEVRLQVYKQRLEVLNFQYKFFRRGLVALLNVQGQASWLTWQNFLDANIKRAVITNPYVLYNIQIGYSTKPVPYITKSSVNAAAKTATVSQLKMLPFYQSVKGGSSRLLFYRSDTNSTNQSSQLITANARNRSGGISNLGGMNYQLHSLQPFLGSNCTPMCVAGGVYSKM